MTLPDPAATGGDPAAAGGELPRVSAVVLAWKAEPWLRRSVEALLASEKVAVEVVLVDNGCTTDDVEVLARLPQVVVVRPGRNLGFSRGCNAGVAASSGEYVALINGDAVVEPNTLARLVDELHQPDVGIAAGAVRLAEDPSLLNSSGNVVHVLGLSWVGGFFEPYFAYHEDADISIRTWRLGLRVMNVPDAVAVHRYEFSRNPIKYYLVERNRLIFVSTLWSARALVLLGPPLLALEVAMVLLAAKQGWLRDKVRGWGWLWRHRRELWARRRLVQGERVVSDREWMRLLTARIDTPLVQVPLRGPLNALMDAYWRLARRGL